MMRNIKYSRYTSQKYYKQIINLQVFKKNPLETIFEIPFFL